MQRDEADNNQSGGDPRELHYYFNGIAVGDIGNNGTSDVDYATSIAEHRAPVATGSHAGAFNYGTVSNVLKSNVNVSTSYADFDQAYDPINGLTYQNTSSQYTVAAGDTLQSIAYQIWGNSSFWYMIADANGLMGDETLSAGQVLTIPNKVHNSHNTSDVFRVYDPNEAIGNNSPTAPKPQKHHSGGCGGIGQILLTIIAVAVVYILAPPFRPLHSRQPWLVRHDSSGRYRRRGGFDRQPGRGRRHWHPVEVQLGRSGARSHRRWCERCDGARRSVRSRGCFRWRFICARPLARRHENC